MKFDFSPNRYFTYRDYRNLMLELVAQGKSTSIDDSESLAQFNQLNNHRMTRWDKMEDKFPDLTAKIAEVSVKQVWWVITESWCGDAAQNLAHLNRIVEANDSIEMRLILRDENPEIMNAFLTNGSKSIPKLVAVEENSEVLFTWGPRPKEAQNLVIEGKKKLGAERMEEVYVELHKWYAKDKGKAVATELFELMCEARLVSC